MADSIQHFLMTLEVTPHKWPLNAKNGSGLPDSGYRVDLEKTTLKKRILET